ncbi:MAG TPA: trehalose-6-phosphate synthase [Acidimicrobiales bacterium]|jgi:trehalose 6-phosphate synthase/phosphatase|nr:trehalose-6-phosphate synthase [Acidimicrobiales bacterium]
MSQAGAASFVVVANRLPVDRVPNADGGAEWRTSPGGLVSALSPVMRQHDGTWVGWSGAADEEFGHFEAEGLHLVSVKLSADEVANFYEGFSNGTLWPLYHDLAAEPKFVREWWDSYRVVNRRFADIVAAEAGPRATVWVQDYQLQLVPQMLRSSRPDLRIGFFNHIPFPGFEIFSQLPWRRQIIEGLLGADLIGFQRGDDASNFLRACRRLAQVTTRGSVIAMRPGPAGRRRLRAGAFPISIDAAEFEALARQPEIQARARQIRSDLGDPEMVLLGVDRLDYTKGIRHRLRAYGELLDDGDLDPAHAVLVQVASPSRDRVEEYRRLREEVETMVGHINGEHSSLGKTAIRYLHQSFPKEEMAALYLAADVMIVTPLRDGMNLVAKEFVACHFDLDGVLVLSEFTGAADELRQALMVNPHDIDGMKAAIVEAGRLSRRQKSQRMRSLRRRVAEFDVHHWANTFLGALDMVIDDSG